MRLLADVAQPSVLAERSVLLPFGVCNGFSGAPNRFFVRRAGVTVEPSPRGSAVLHAEMDALCPGR